MDTLNLKLAHQTVSQRLMSLFYPHGEHVILFARLTAMFDYWLEGELNFRTLFFVGNATLLATSWVLYRTARQAGLSLIQTMPIFCLLFQPQFYENTFTWAICAVFTNLETRKTAVLDQVKILEIDPEVVESFSRKKEIGFIPS